MSELKIIAKIYNNFDSKFGIPRQSGLSEIKSKIVFEPEYRIDEALRGIEEFSHLWLIWGFSENENADWSPTVRPPRLGGNTRKGVFATRSPFRPNGLGLSSVKFESIKKTQNEGTLLYVCGADLMNGTPIYDIKPYIAYTDCHTDAKSSFSCDGDGHILKVNFPDDLKKNFSEEMIAEITKILSFDPRPSYHNDSERIYGMKYGGYDFRFSVDGDVLKVVSVDIGQ